MDNNYLETIEKNREIINKIGINYSIWDTESIYGTPDKHGGYWDIQWLKKGEKKASHYPSEKDINFYNIYKSLDNLNLPMYFYNAPYDKSMLNALCKFVENKETNIAYKMRRFNDYMIQGKLQYDLFNRDFWCNYYFKFKEKVEKGDMFIDDLMQYSIDNFLENNPQEIYQSFFNEFPYLLGTSKVIKKLNILDIPRMLFYYSIQKDGTTRLTVGLKNLQLFHEGTQLKFDFNQYNNIQDIRNNGLQEYFTEYSLNDVEFLERFFLHSIAPILINRFYACTAIKQYNPEFEFDVNGDVIHSQTNTNLLNIFTKDLSKEKEQLKRCMNIKNSLCRDERISQINVKIHDFEKILEDEDAFNAGEITFFGEDDFDNAKDNIERLEEEKEHLLSTNIQLIATKQMDKRLNEIYTLIENGGNDGADIAFYSDEIEELNKERDRIINEKINDCDEKIVELQNTIDGNIDIDYTEHIKETGFETFDNFVKFANKNKHINNDRDIKDLYAEEFNQTVREIDRELKKQVDNDENVSSVECNIDTFDLYGCNVKIGFGGIHGAIENYHSKSGKLWVVDYESLYPSIIKMFKQYYEKIMNIDLYLSLFEFRNVDIKEILSGIGTKIEGLEEDIKRIKEGCKDLSNVSNETLQLIEKKIKQLEELQKDNEFNTYLLGGVKLLLNSLYGLLNSIFNFTFANKSLGRFICLYGQYRAIQLSKIIKEVNPNIILVNINTDGIYLDNATKEEVLKIIELDGLNGLKLDLKPVDEIYQVDVNNYLKFEKGKLKTKGGLFKSSVKQQFIRFGERIPCNVVNALKFMENKTNIEILPIYFHTDRRKCTVVLEGENDSRNKVYYLTNYENGKRAVKNVGKPQILHIDGNVMYFTTDKEKADIKEYTKFARLTEERIKSFRMTKNKTLYYRPEELSIITDKEEISKRRKVKNKLSKLLNKNIGFMNKHKKVLAKYENDKMTPTTDYTTYKTTEIMSSTEFDSICFISESNHYVAITNDNESIEKLRSLKTFESTHEESGYSLFIFNIFSINPEDFPNIKFETQISEYVIWNKNEKYKINECEVL